MNGSRTPARSIWIPALTVLLLAGLVTAAVTANSWKHEFRVLRVRAEGNRIVADSELVRIAGIPTNARLFDIDLNAARLRVLGNPFIRSASLGRDVPDAVVITVTERTPVAALVRDRILYVDGEGIVLPPARAGCVFDLPVITGEIPAAECVPGRRLKSRTVLDAVEVLTTASAIGEDLAHLISEVHCTRDSALVLYTAESGVPVMFGRGDIVMKLLEFEGFWTQMVMQRGASALKSVDLRFADQVVVRWNGGAGGSAE